MVPAVCYSASETFPTPPPGHANTLSSPALSVDRLASPGAREEATARFHPAGILLTSLITAYTSATLPSQQALPSDARLPKYLAEPAQAA